MGVAPVGRPSRTSLELRARDLLGGDAVGRLLLAADEAPGARRCGVAAALGLAGLRRLGRRLAEALGDGIGARRGGAEREQRQRRAVQAREERAVDREGARAAADERGRRGDEDEVVLVAAVRDPRALLAV